MLLTPVAFTVADPDNVPEDSWLKVGEVSTDAGGYMYEIKNLNPGFYETKHRIRRGEAGSDYEEWQSLPPIRGEVRSNDPEQWSMICATRQAIHDKLMASGDESLRQATIKAMQYQNPGLTEEEAVNADYTSIAMPYGYGWLRGAVQEPLESATLTAGGGITVNRDWFNCISSEHAEEGSGKLKVYGSIEEIDSDGETYYDLVLYKSVAKLEVHTVARYQNIVKEAGLYGLRWKTDNSVASVPAQGMVRIDTLAAREDIVIEFVEQKTLLFSEHYVRKVG